MEVVFLLFSSPAHPLRPILGSLCPSGSRLRSWCWASTGAAAANWGWGWPLPEERRKEEPGPGASPGEP